MNCTKFDIDIVATGSSGNMTIIDGCIALDFGVPAKVLSPYIDKLSAILITHRHGDHMNPPALNALVKNRPGLLRSGLYINQWRRRQAKRLHSLIVTTLLTQGKDLPLALQTGHMRLKHTKCPTVMLKIKRLF